MTYASIKSALRGARLFRSEYGTRGQVFRAARDVTWTGQPRVRVEVWQRSPATGAWYFATIV